MSSKSTIILTKDNEHVYYDGNSRTICIEVQSYNVEEYCPPEYDDERHLIEIKCDSELGRFLYNRLYKTRDGFSLELGK